MNETVIFPLSEETGVEILNVLKRIARALEGNTGDTATYDNGTLDISGSATVENGVLGTTATYENGTLSF